MNDFRAMVNGRYHMTVFIIGPQYVTVLHRDHTMDEVLGALAGHLEELKKPFVIVSQNVLPAEDFRYIADNDLADIVLE